MNSQDDILLFTKRVQINNNTKDKVRLEYTGNLSVSKHMKLSQLRRILSSSSRQGGGDSLASLNKQWEIYEIVTPEEINHLDRSKDEMTLDDLELMHGDIICYEECVIRQDSDGKIVVTQHLKEIRNSLEEELNRFEITIYRDETNELKVEELKVYVSLEMTYEDMAIEVAKELIRKGWEDSLKNPLTLQFIPWEPNASVHFYEAVEYDESATLKRILVTYGQNHVSKSFKYAILPLPVNEIEGTEQLNIILSINGNVRNVNCYLEYGSTFVDVFNQLERYGLLEVRNIRKRFRILALRDRRVHEIYSLETSLDASLSRVGGRDEIMIEEIVREADALVQILHCYASDRVVLFGYPSTFSVRRKDTCMELNMFYEKDSDVTILCDESKCSKSKNMKKKIELKENDILFDLVPGLGDDENMTPIIYIRHNSRKVTKNASTVHSQGITID